MARYGTNRCGQVVSAFHGILETMPTETFDDALGTGGSDPTGRTLRLLSLLQAHRQWSGTELADRLGVTTRTLRRDIERLRRLGYPVEAVPGVGGGYQLAAGPNLPPLVLDDDEAVAIAVGLRVATRATINGIEETSVRALAKLEQVLPDRVRRRVGAVRGSITTMYWTPDVDDAVDADDLAVLAQACRDQEEVRFDYRRRDGEESNRLVHPYQLVATGRRWYLAAWDVRRTDWRTFRLDRLTGARLAGVRFEPRPLPAEDAAAYVAQSLASAPRTWHGVVTAEIPQERAREILHWGDRQIEPIGADRCRAEIRSDWLGELVSMVGQLATAGAVRVESPPELVAAVAELATNLKT